MSEIIRVLHVEDDPDFADLVSTFLQGEDDRLEVITSENPKNALDIIDEYDIDCVVSDYDMPFQNGIQFLKEVREEYPEIPFILYTGKGSEELASDAISAGVTDYLQKGMGTSQYQVLANRIINYVDKYHAQKELANRENRLNLFIEQSPLGVIRWDDEFNIARLNDTAEELFGYTEEELVGKPWHIVIPEEDHDEIEDIVVGDLLANEGGYHNINENLGKDGERIVCEWHNWVVTDDDGDVVAVYSQFQDITDRREQNRELERYLAITEASTNTIITTDDKNIIQSVNPAIEEMFGYSPEEVYGENLTILMSDDLADKHLDAFNRYQETGEKAFDWNDLETTGKHKDGTDVPLSLSIGEIEFEGEQFFVGIIRDISERKKRERELMQTRERFQSIFESSNDAIFVLDPENDSIVDANPGAEELLGYSREEMMSSVGISDIHRNDLDQFRAFLNQVKNDETGRRGDFKYVTKYGEKKECEISVASTEFGDNQYIIAIVRDITNRKDYERQLEQFASIVSHDLRNPLNVAEGRLILARQDCESEHLVDVENAHNRMRTLIEDLLALARKDDKNIQKEPIAFQGIAEESWTNIRTSGANLNNEINQRIFADEGLVKQILENLFRNAVEHGGSDVTVNIGALDNGFYIEDNGPGISAENQDKVFELGYTTESEGTGLGLAIVKDAVEALDWTIRIMDSDQGGVRFEISWTDLGDQ